MDDTRSNFIIKKSWICRSVKVELIGQLTILPSDVQLLPEICWRMCHSRRGEEASYLGVVDLGSSLGEAGRLVVGMCILLFDLWLGSSCGLDSGRASSAAHVRVLVQ